MPVHIRRHLLKYEQYTANNCFGLPTYTGLSLLANFWRSFWILGSIMTMQ